MQCYWKRFDRSHTMSPSYYCGTFATIAGYFLRISLQSRLCFCHVKIEFWIVLLRVTCRFGAKDFNANAIKIACSIANDELIHCLLARCSHRDTEHKLNETDLLIDCNLGETLPSYCNTYCNLFPTHPTVINWNFETCQLNEIRWVFICISNFPNIYTFKFGFSVLFSLAKQNQMAIGRNKKLQSKAEDVVNVEPHIAGLCDAHRYLTQCPYNAAARSVQHVQLAPFKCGAK